MEGYNLRAAFSRVPGRVVETEAFLEKRGSRQKNSD